jgi:hypothetical protein
VANYKRLSPHEEELLRRVVSKHRPDLPPLLALVGVEPLTAEQREELRDPVATELLEQGVDDEGGVNAPGMELESLIDRLWELSDRS